MVQGFQFKVQRCGVEVEDLGSRVEGLRLRVKVYGLRA